MIANPLAGALSRPDHARGWRAGAFGRRHLWTAGGALLGAPALVLLARQQTIAGVALAWVAAQVCFNAMLASLTAAVPDRVPVAQRGGVSGWIGIPQALGLVARRGAGHRRWSPGSRAGLPGRSRVALLVLALPFALLTPDDPLPRTHRPPLRLRALLASMWISPRAAPGLRLGLADPVPGADSATRSARSTCSTSSPTGCATATPRAGCWC